MLNRKLPYIVISISIFTWATAYTQTTPPPPPAGAPPGFPIPGILILFIAALGFGIYNSFHNPKKK